MRKYFTLFAAFLLTITLTAQQKEPFAVFDLVSHDFGRIKEEAGPVTYKFSFTNTGSLPLIIKEVKASCGCTSPDWTRQPILPGTKGFVAATYNPQGRPGPFMKTITVTSNATNNPIVLKINGVVSEKEKKPEDLFPHIMDSIRLTGNFFYFDSIYYGETKTKKIEIWNVRKDAATITFNNIPKHVKVAIIPETLKPNQKGFIEVTYNAKAKNDWGYVSDNLMFVVNAKVIPTNRITVSADIKENFAAMTAADLEKAPKAVIPENHFEFGTVKKGETVKHDFEIRNEGKSDLLIRKVSSSCGCTVAEMDTKVIKPGETKKVPAVLNTTSKKGATHISITILTNDPKNAKTILFMRGEVQE